MKCSICRIDLNALNMSDIEYDKCQDCVRNIINKIDTNDESIETRYIPDSSLDSIIKQKNDQTWNNAHSRHKTGRYSIPRRRWHYKTKVNEMI